MCLVVYRSASKTRPKPMALRRMEVVYTGVRSVFCKRRQQTLSTAELLHGTANNKGDEETGVQSEIHSSGWRS